MTGTSTDLSRDHMSASATDRVLSDLSVRALVQLPKPQSVGLAVRGDASDNHGYWLHLSPQVGYLRLYRSGDDLVELGQFALPFDLSDQEFFLQMDAQGGSIRAWSWLAGEPMPADPQIDVMDDTFGDGTVRLIGYRNANTDAAAIFRSVQVSDSHIPEPATAALSVLGVLSLVTWRRGSPSRNVSTRAVSA